MWKATFILVRGYLFAHLSQLSFGPGASSLYGLSHSSRQPFTLILLSVSPNHVKLIQSRCSIITTRVGCSSMLSSALKNCGILSDYWRVEKLTVLHFYTLKFILVFQYSRSGSIRTFATVRPHAPNHKNVYPNGRMILC